MRVVTEKGLNHVVIGKRETITIVSDNPSNRSFPEIHQDENGKLTITLKGEDALNPDKLEIVKEFNMLDFVREFFIKNKLLDEDGFNRLVKS